MSRSYTSSPPCVSMVCCETVFFFVIRYPFALSSNRMLTKRHASQGNVLAPDRGTQIRAMTQFVFKEDISCERFVRHSLQIHVNRTAFHIAYLWSQSEADSQWIHHLITCSASSGWHVVIIGHKMQSDTS
jgi:hypothetical protein